MRLFLCAACLLAGHALFGQPTRDTEYIDHPPLAKAERGRIRGTRRIDREAAAFLIELPPQVFFPAPAPAVVTGRLEVAHAVLPFQRSVEVPLRFNPAGHPLAPVKVTMELQDAPDGEFTLRLRVPGLPEASAAWLPPEVPIRKVSAAVARIAPEHRADIDAWIREANTLSMIWNKQPLWPNLDKALLQPDAPATGLRGFLLHSYDNAQLRRRQPYTVYVPASLDLEKPAPLMILLHGSGGDYRNLIADFAAAQEFETHPMLIANAGAFLNTEFRHMALHDVTRILEDMSRRYAIDPSRVYLQGISLGGRGVLDLAALLPDTFAAVSSQGPYGIHHELLDPAFPQFRDPVALRLAARNDIRTWLPNLLNTPAEIVFGWKDESTRPVGALAIAIVLERIGATVVERGFNTGHNISVPEYDWATTREWFLTQRKNLWPDRIHFRVHSLRHNRQAWLQVDALHDYSGVGEVKARMLPTGKLELETRNIAQLRYLPPPRMVPEPTHFPREAQVFHFDAANNLLETPSERNGSPTKHSGQCGPLWTLFSEPLILVLDTSLPEAEQIRLRRYAETAAHTDAEPGPWRFPIKTDAELTEEERVGHNLLWITTSDSQHPWRELLPVPLPEAAAALRAGKPHALFALRPSPWNPQRSVVVAQIHQQWTPSLYRMGTFQEFLQPDWMILEGQRILAAGVYAHDWSPAVWTREAFDTRILTR